MTPIPIEQFHELFSPFLQLVNFQNIEKNVVLTARVMIFAAFEYIDFARGLRALPLCQCDFKAISQFFSCTLGTLSIDNEMGRRRRPEVKFSRANLMGMRQVVKTSSSLRRRRNSGRFAIVAKT